MRIDELSKLVKQIILNHGFSKVGITNITTPPKSDFLNNWLNSKYHGENPAG